MWTNNNPPTQQETRRFLEYIGIGNLMTSDHKKRYPIVRTRYFKGLSTIISVLVLTVLVYPVIFPVLFFWSSITFLTYT